MSEMIDEELQEWLATPEGQEFLRAQNPSILFSILHSLMLILLGAVYCCSLILFWDGVHCLWQGLTFHPVRTTGISREQFRNLQAVVAYPVRIGPGRPTDGSTCRAWLLSEFDWFYDEEVGRFAQRCDALFDGEQPSRDEQEFARMLRDNSFQANRRRKVPRLAAPYWELYLLDLWVNPELNHPINGYSILAATHGPTGVAFQIPCGAISPPDDM